MVMAHGPHLHVEERDLNLSTSVVHCHALQIHSLPSECVGEKKKILNYGHTGQFISRSCVEFQRRPEVAHIDHMLSTCPMT